MRVLWGLVGRPRPPKPYVDLLLGRLPPPAPGKAELTAPPEFVGIGAQKSGTSWWFNLIAQHPRVYANDALRAAHFPSYLHKERHFFDAYCARDFSRSDARSYAEWFARPEGMIAGEWTPRYMVDHWVAPALKAAAPDTRLLILLRDPVRRLESGLVHELRRKDVLNPADLQNHVMRSQYALHLSWWFRYFDRDRILVLQYERCIQNPAEQLDRTFRFLGLEPVRVTPAVVSERVNAGEAGGAFSLSQAREALLADLLRNDVLELAQLCPEIDVSLWPSVGLGSTNSERVGFDPTA